MRTKVMLPLVMVVVLMVVGCAKKDESAPAATPPTTAAAAAAGTTVPTTAKATTTVAAAPGVVTIADYQFNPENRTAKVGEKIVWTNTDAFAHFVKSDAGIDLDSGSLERGATYSRTFDKPGTFAYHCEIHNIMKGTVTVS